MQTRALGRSGIEISAIGLGVMGMSEFYGEADEAENTATLARALELGVNFWDTADAYGTGHNERLIGRFLSRAPRARPRGARHQVRLRARRRRAPGRDPRRRRVRGLGLRRQPRAPRRRADRSLLPAPRRPERADRGHGRRDGRARARGQGARARSLRVLRRDPAPRLRRAPDRRGAERVFAVEPRSGEAGRDPRCVSRAGRGLRRLQPARARLPDRQHRQPRRARRRRLPPPHAALRARQLRAQPGPRREAFARSRRRRAARPVSSRWRGCSREART